jgi:hypothetical protein
MVVNLILAYLFMNLQAGGPLPVPYHCGDAKLQEMLISFSHKSKIVMLITTPTRSPQARNYSPCSCRHHLWKPDL